MRYRAAFWAVLFLFLYYNVDRWAPLGNWNGQHQWPVVNDQFTLDLIVAAILTTTLLSFYRGIRWGMVLGTALLALWTYFHLQAWWIPYAQGVHSARAIAFHSHYLQHTQVLPSWRKHFAPDAEHTFIDIFVFPAFFLCLLACVRAFKGAPYALRSTQA